MSSKHFPKGGLQVRKLATVSFIASLALVTLGALLIGLPSVVDAQGPDDGISAQTVVDTTFTYQGRLTDGETLANGIYDFVFNLYNAETEGEVIGEVEINGVTVSDGLFAVELDFQSFVGAAFTGQARWLEILVKRPGEGDYITLEPRVALTAVPYAHSLRPGAKVESTGTALRLSTSATSGMALEVTSSAISGNAAAVYASSGSPNGAGLSGYNSSSGYGVYGGAWSGTGVYGTAPTTGTVGIATASTGTSYGVYGRNASSSGAGVYGTSGHSSGLGVHGHSSSGGDGVRGTSINGNGVWGGSTGGDGVSGASTNGSGVYGRTDSSTNDSAGVYGVATASSGSIYGVYGQATASEYGSGVLGKGKQAGVHGIGISSGETYGVLGETGSSSGIGVYGTALTTGTVGIATAMSGAAYGVYGLSYSSSGAGVYGKSDHSSGLGVHGHSTSGEGVRGTSISGKGVAGYSNSGDGVWGGSTSGYGVYSQGNAHVEGNLTWQAKTGYISVPPAAFQPDSNEDYTNDGYVLFWPGGLSIEVRGFVAPVFLPHNATVKSLTVYVYCRRMIDSGSDAITVRLLRSNFGDGFDEVAVVIPDHDTLSGNYTSYSATSINNYANVSNSQYTYYLELWMYNGNSIDFRGVTIEYEFSKPY